MTGKHMDNYHQMAAEACRDYSPLKRVRLRLIDGQIEVDVSCGDIAFVLDRLSPADTEKAWKSITEGFELQGVIVAKSDAAWDELFGMNEVFPGVFIEDGSVHIVDDIGEVVMWDFTELAEDPDAMAAAFCAVATAATLGPQKVRARLPSSHA